MYLPRSLFSRNSDSPTSEQCELVSSTVPVCVKDLIVVAGCLVVFCLFAFWIVPRIWRTRCRSACADGQQGKRCKSMSETELLMLFKYMTGRSSRPFSCCITYERLPSCETRRCSLPQQARESADDRRATDVHSPLFGIHPRPQVLYWFRR
ncbi:hypothetical protein EDD16DRAFT_608506 [Pisolithus croceorrhizus]|nr:hypothetical protein EDD16DRAFT_608506 [Pisolithus croceorrhizus]KAI6156468.1 hypothetical protein EDD17DRAFT_1018132 [Pisolithus thermaeus]